jgi:hypothetical protein
VLLVFIQRLERGGRQLAWFLPSFGRFLCGSGGLVLETEKKGLEWEDICAAVLCLSGALFSYPEEQNSSVFEFHLGFTFFVRSRLLCGPCLDEDGNPYCFGFSYPAC